VEICSVIKLFKQTFVMVLAATCLLGCSSTLQSQELSERQKVAMAMFQERCKKAGEFIRRTDEGVEAVLLEKMRPDGINYGDQYRLDDPYGRDLTGEGYIGSFLRGSYEAWSGKMVPISEASRGYAFVEAIDSKDKVRYRYTGAIKDVTRTKSVMNGGDGKTQFTVKEFVIERSVVSGAEPRYAVTYDDISTHEERDYWIAGSSLKVIDRKTNEVIAERIGYMVDAFQGSRVGGRSPWLFAASNACPVFRGQHAASDQTGQASRFVEKVLKPKIK
jgi:hypothetical protein